MLASSSLLFVREFNLKRTVRNLLLWLVERARAAAVAGRDLPFLADRAERIRYAEQLRCAQLWVAAEKPQQLAADIARGPKDRRPNHEAGAYRPICIFMQVNA